MTISANCHCQARRDLFATVEWTVTDTGIASEKVVSSLPISCRPTPRGLGLAIFRRIIEQMGLATKPMT